MKWQDNENIISLSPQQLEKVLDFGTTLKCPKDTPLFYEGHIPIVVYVLKSGIIQIGKSRKETQMIRPGQVIGLKDFSAQTPSLFWATALKDSELIYIDKSTLNEIIHHGPNELKSKLIAVAS